MSCATAITLHGHNRHSGQIHPHRQDSMDNRPPYVAYGHCGNPMIFSYTEEVVGSSPIPPTFYPQGWGVFVNNAYMWGLLGCPDSPGVKSCATVCSLDITSKGLCRLPHLAIEFCNDFRTAFDVHSHLWKIRTDEESQHSFCFMDIPSSRTRNLA